MFRIFAKRIESIIGRLIIQIGLQLKKKTPLGISAKGGSVQNQKKRFSKHFIEARSVRASAPTAEQNCEICAVGCAVGIDVSCWSTPCAEQGCQVRTIAEPVVVEIT